MPVASQLLDLATREGDSEQLLEAHLGQGNTALLQGALMSAKVEFEEALRLYDENEHRSQAFLYGFDPAVFCLCKICWILQFMGYPDQAREKTKALLELANGVSDR